MYLFPQILRNRGDKVQDDTKQTQEVMAKRTAKNSVFLDLFQNKSYLLRLYKTLHPEDTTATEDSLTDVTIENVLIDNLYSDKDDIINQYIIFCKVFNEQTKQHGMTQKAVMETIRICKDRNVLREYLLNREKEVVTIMMSLFDEEQIMNSFIRSERHDEARETAERLIKKGKMSLDEIAECVPTLSLDELKELEAEVMQLA